MLDNSLAKKAITFVLRATCIALLRDFIMGTMLPAPCKVLDQSAVAKCGTHITLTIGRLEHCCDTMQCAAGMLGFTPMPIEGQLIAVLVHFTRLKTRRYVPCTHALFGMR